MAETTDQAPCLRASAGILDDLVERRLAGAAEDREDGAVGQMVDGIVAPFVGRDHAAVEPQDLVEFASVEGDGQVHPIPSRLVERDQY